jgi:hypothetical protein
MAKIINFDEERIMRALNRAEDELRSTRTLISYGDYEYIEQAIELETKIRGLEQELIELIENSEGDECC